MKKIIEYKICIGAKILEGCGKSKPVDEFPLDKGCRTNTCKKCTSTYKRNKYAAERDDTSTDNLFQFAVSGKW